VLSGGAPPPTEQNNSESAQIHSPNMFKSSKRTKRLSKPGSIFSGKTLSASIKHHRPTAIPENFHAAFVIPVADDAFHDDCIGTAGIDSKESTGLNSYRPATAELECFCSLYPN
jgi:hypothetical protein